MFNVDLLEQKKAKNKTRKAKPLPTVKAVTPASPTFVTPKPSRRADRR